MTIIKGAPQSKMAIDDELEISLAQLANSAEADPGHELINIAIKMIPIVGSGIDELMSGLAQRRLVERILDVFGQMKSQLNVLMEDQIRKEYFTSEEFQTLLALALQEIQTTPDRKKLEMIAAALCNSGKVQFQDETKKQLYVRVLSLLNTSESFTRLHLSCCQTSTFQGCGPRAWIGLRKGISSL